MKFCMRLFSPKGTAQASAKVGILAEEIVVRGLTYFDGAIADRVVNRSPRTISPAATVESEIYCLSPQRRFYKMLPLFPTTYRAIRKARSEAPFNFGHRLRDGGRCDRGYSEPAPLFLENHDVSFSFSPYFLIEPVKTLSHPPKCANLTKVAERARSVTKSALTKTKSPGA